MTRSTVRPFDCLSDIFDALRSTLRPPAFCKSKLDLPRRPYGLFIRYNGRAGESERVG